MPVSQICSTVSIVDPCFSQGCRLLPGGFFFRGDRANRFLTSECLKGLMVISFLHGLRVYMDYGVLRTENS